MMSMALFPLLFPVLFHISLNTLALWTVFSSPEVLWLQVVSFQVSQYGFLV